MLIGREKEITVLQESLASLKTEMIAAIGRRRVGKFFLVDEYSLFYLRFIEDTAFERDGAFLQLNDR